MRPVVTDVNISVSSLRMKLKSLKSKDSAKIRFHNTFKRQVRAMWMDFEGHEVMPRSSPTNPISCCCMHADTQSNRAGTDLGFAL